MDHKHMELLGLTAGAALIGGLTGYFIANRSSSNSDDDMQDHFNKPFLKKNAVTDYILANSLNEHASLKALRDYSTENVDMAVMISDPIQVQFFRMLLKSIGAKKCLEVGVYTGYNVLSCALALPDDGKVYGLDINDRWVNEGRPFFKQAGVEDKIDIRIVAADKGMNDLISAGHTGTFDFIYVDANKEGYDGYYEQGLVLLRKGGIIAFDNMLQQGRVAAMDKLDNVKQSYVEDVIAIDALNKKLHKDDRVETVFLNIADGVNFARKL